MLFSVVQSHTGSQVQTRERPFPLGVKELIRHFSQVTIDVSRAEVCYGVISMGILVERRVEWAYSLLASGLLYLLT